MLNNVNRQLLKRILQQQPLKVGVECDAVIEIIIDFGNYLQMKYKAGPSLEDEQRKQRIDTYTKEFIEMIRMLCYGILDVRED